MSDWVTTGKAQTEQRSSALPPIATDAQTSWIGSFVPGADITEACDDSNVLGDHVADGACPREGLWLRDRTSSGAEQQYQSVLRKLTRSFFCWSVKPMPKR